MIEQFESTELIEGTESVTRTDEALLEASRAVWEREVRARAHNQCSNCGGADRLRVHTVVPFGAGGRLVESNGVLLCRTCDMARDFVSETDKTERWPVNVWVSRRLYDRIQETIRLKNGVRSMSSLARYLISKYVTDEDAFEDLEQYQEAGNDVKINVWVDRDRYETFQVLLKRRGMTVTDALKALFRMFDSEAKAVARKQ